MAVSFKGAHFPSEVILPCIRWYLAYPLSYRHVEELMEERGVAVDHSTVNRWVIKYSPQLEAEFHRRKRSVWTSWRMDETYIKVRGRWVYLYRAVDKMGQTIDFLLTEKRDMKAARRFLTKAIGRNGTPEKINIDKSGANAAAIVSYNWEHGTTIEIRKNKYLNNIVEQDHRGVKRVTRPMLGFKSFDAAQSTLTGIELMRMLRKGQLEGEDVEGLTAAKKFYALRLTDGWQLTLKHPLSIICDKTHHRLTGAVNPKDFQFHIMDACFKVNGAPDQKDWAFELTPVDFLVQSLVRFAQDPVHFGQVYHVVQDHPMPAHVLFDYLIREQHIAQTIPVEQWLAQLEAAATEREDEILSVLAQSLPDVEAYLLDQNVYDDSRFVQAIQSYGMARPTIDFNYYEKFIQRHSVGLLSH